MTAARQRRLRQGSDGGSVVRCLAFPGDKDEQLNIVLFVGIKIEEN